MIFDLRRENSNDFELYNHLFCKMFIFLMNGQKRHSMVNGYIGFQDLPWNQSMLTG
jgi:hypothetical protein